MSTFRADSNAITVSVAASLLSLSSKTVYAACADGRIKAVKVAGHWSVDAASLFALDAANSCSVSGRKTVSLGSRLAAQATCRIRGMEYGQL